MGMTRGRTRRFTSPAFDLADEIKEMTERSNGTGLCKWGEDLVCPVCFGALRFSDAAVVCASCERSYPVVDGIPVLIAKISGTRSSR